MSKADELVDGLNLKNNLVDRDDLADRTIKLVSGN